MDIWDSKNLPSWPSSIFSMFSRAPISPASPSSMPPVSPGDPRIQNAPDLNRVVRSDNRTERQDTGDAAGGNQALRYDSNSFFFLGILIFQLTVPI